MFFVATETQNTRLKNVDFFVAGKVTGLASNSERP